MAESQSPTEASIGAPAATDVEAPTLPATGLEPSELSAGARTDPGVSMLGREIIGQYVIRETLGSGGMGEVYLAEQPALGRKVAIKVLHPQLRGLEGQLERFRNEAKAAASLPSAHIVEIFNWGELDDGTLFMAMEYLHGQTLAELLRERGSLEPELCVAIAAQICTALGEAHAAGIVHRDLKPSNVMLLARDDEELPFQVKVLDFGVAKLEGSDITRSGAMFGTPQYMSPEQLRAGAIDGRSDLYSLGVMLYEMLSGELPFRSDSAVGYITAHLHDKPAPLAREIPRSLAEFVRVLLSKDPDKRPEDAASAQLELQASLRGGTPAARRRARRRLLRRMAVVTTLSAVIVALGLSAWQMWRRWDQAQDQLAQQQERAEVLERKLDEQKRLAAEAREQTKELVQQQMESSNKVREQREAAAPIRDRARPTKLDAQTRAMLTQSLAELETQLRGEIELRRVPPSESTDMWTIHEQRLAAVASGELEETAVREQLVTTILLYRKSFARKRGGDDQPLERLEQRFMTMAMDEELGAEERRAMIDAVFETYDDKDELDEADRDYYKRLALAKLVRQHLRRRPKDPTLALPHPEDEEAGADPGEAQGSGASSGPREPGDAPGLELPSLEGL